ncbi:lipoate-protein ligase A [Peptoclostridium litorale DSM 5388]|uniref:Octanoyltransferase LipM n=1 Tax=Peptoclostridium litorale DSM 5388 TaxID=1121324 RepID=A0A069REY0_PEPLI|nr:biotin/lipoate A/B protein ligase family protein [Peptoclostridium litorale]KDR95571.1 octanoyltransferase LipM [Peptoclostridium litorale DSM 5388]SIN98533.1 lipoate-protein ligase A [Peptoclostridium litorale DSM 5388]
MKWRFINTDFNSGPMNMAIDEAILSYHSKGLVPPTLRFYRWDPATISLGYFQKSDKEVDIAQCKASGIDVVRRLSGGRAVLHDSELTYSLIVSEDYPMLPKSITESYKIISGGLLKGFDNMGISADLSPVVSLKNKEFTSSACFDAPSTYELTVGGKKIVGSSQVRQLGVVLQHGSVLNDLDVEKLFSTIKMSSPKAKERIKSSFTQKATSIKHEQGECAKWEDLCNSFFNGFKDALDLDIEIGSLTDEEMEMAKVLCETKYSRDEWTFRR